MAADYRTPEWGAKTRTRYNVWRHRQRTGFKWVYNVECGLTRERPDVRPGAVVKSLVETISEMEQDDGLP